MRPIVIVFLLSCLLSCQSNKTDSSTQDRDIVTPKAYTAQEAESRRESQEGEPNLMPQLESADEFEKIDWDTLKKVKFEDKFYEEINSYLLYPTFSEDLKQMQGEKVAIQGYVIPISPGRYVLSANPFASCFFCGNAGPESVMELSLKDTTAVYFSDDFKAFGGTFKLNDSDIDRLNYILEDAIQLKTK